MWIGNSFIDGDSFDVSGWGTLSEGGSLSSKLRKVSVPYVSDEGNFTFFHNFFVFPSR